MRISDWSSDVCSSDLSKILPVAAHAESGSADRSTKIEGEDLAAFVAPELQRHQRQQHGFASPCRADDEAVTDIADMKGKAERSEERRVGKECVGTGSSRWAQND